MKNRIKYWLASILVNRMMRKVGKKITDLEAAKFNHLQALLMTRGRVRWDWNKIRMKRVVKCKRCCLVLSAFDHHLYDNKSYCKKCIKDVKEKK